MAFETLRTSVDKQAGVGSLVLHRPAKSNAISWKMFQEIPVAVAALDADPNVRVVVLRGEGRNFCSGIDLATFDEVMGEGVGEGMCEARLRGVLLDQVKVMQDSNTCLENCRKPVLELCLLLPGMCLSLLGSPDAPGVTRESLQAAVHGACWGGGIDMINDATFSVKEVDLAITADLGTLQRLPHLVGHGRAMDLALSARVFTGQEAAEMGLTARSFPSREAMDAAMNELASSIAAKSPLAVEGTKATLLHARENTVAAGLTHVAIWNAAFLRGSGDMAEALSAMKQRRRPIFSKL